MTRTARTAGALAALVAALLSAAPTNAAPTGQSAAPAPISTPVTSNGGLAANKKASRGVLSLDPPLRFVGVLAGPWAEVCALVLAAGREGPAGLHRPFRWGAFAARGVGA